jgi:hypothetical protein
VPIASLIRLLANPQEIAAVAERKATGAVFLVLAGLAFITALGFAAASLWAVIAPDLGPAGASLVLAGAFVVLALILLLIGRLTQRRKAAPPAPAAAPPADPIMAVIANLFGNSQAAMLAGTLVAGYLAERARKRRDSRA